MELEKIQINEKQKDNNIIITESKIHNIETSESINIPKNEKNELKNNNENERLSKLSNLINRKDSLFNKLNSKFKRWKKLTFISKRKIGTKTKKILIKKTLNIQRPSKSKNSLNEKNQKIKIIKKVVPLDFNEETEKRNKIIKFIESRIMSYMSRKDILKKYYQIWNSKVSKDIINTNKITKKTITQIKIKDKHPKSGEEQKDIIEENKDKNAIIEREEKIKNIIKSKEPLKVYFKIWKYKLKNKENEIEDQIKSSENLKAQDTEQKTKTIVTIKQITTTETSIIINRKKKLIKIIKHNDTEALRKYFYKWMSLIKANFELELNNEKSNEENLIEVDKPIKIITGFENYDIDNDNNNNEIIINEEKIEIQNTNKPNKDKNIINKRIIKKHIIKKDLNNKIKEGHLEQNINTINLKNNDSPLNKNEDIMIKFDEKEEKYENKSPLKNIKNNEINIEETSHDIKAKDPQISNDEFILYKIIHDKFINDEQKSNLDKNNYENIDKNEIKNINLKKNIFDEYNNKKKLEKIILKKNPLKIYFKIWKKNINVEKEEEEKNDNGFTKKIITQKKVIYKKNKLEPKDSQIYIIKKEQPIIEPDKRYNNKIESKILEIIKKRIATYQSKKQILKKYYDRWITKSSTGIIKESVVNKIINKKILSFKKKKKNIVNDNSDINAVKKNLFSSENNIENNNNLEFLKNNEKKTDDINMNLYENINKLDKEEEIPKKSDENDILKNNILRLSLQLKNEEEQENIKNNQANEEQYENNNIIISNKPDIFNTNNIIKEENEEKKTSLQKEKDIKDNELKFINDNEKNKIEKLKKIMENISPLKLYFNRFKTAIYIKNKNKEREKILQSLEKIYYRNIIKKYFEIFRNYNIEIKEDIENIYLTKNDENKNLINEPENKYNLENIKNKDENNEKIKLNVLKNEKDVESKKNVYENDNEVIINEISNKPYIQNKSDTKTIESKELSKLDKTDNLEKKIIPKNESKGQKIDNKTKVINLVLNENIENNNLYNKKEGIDNEDKKDIKDLNEGINDINISEIGAESIRKEKPLKDNNNNNEIKNINEEEPIKEQKALSEIQLGKIINKSLNNYYIIKKYFLLWKEKIKIQKILDENETGVIEEKKEKEKTQNLFDNENNDYTKKKKINEILEKNQRLNIEKNMNESKKKSNNLNENILEKPKKEVDVNLNNKKNEILIKESDESPENKNPLMTTSSNEQIEFINIYDKEKEGTKENNLKDYIKKDKDTINLDNKPKQVFENENNLNDIKKINETETEKEKENIIYKKPEIININEDNDKNKTENNNLNSQYNEVFNENETKAEINKKAIEKIISILEEININTQKTILRNGFEKWKIYNNKIDEDDKKVKIESNGLGDSGENNNNKTELKKESEKVLNLNDVNAKVEYKIIENPQKEGDINLINNKDNKNLIEGAIRIDKNLENKNPVMIISTNTEIESNNINENNKENENKEKKEQKEIYTKEEINKEQNNNAINIDNEREENIGNKNNLNDIKKINEKEPEKVKDNIGYQKSDIININDDINKDEINDLNHEKNESSKENEIIIERNKKRIEKIISILVKINDNIEKNILKNGFEKWNNYNNKIDENDKKAKIESKIQEDIEKNKISKKELEKYSEKDLNINDDNNNKSKI